MWKYSDIIDYFSVMWHIKINHNNCMNRKVDAFISQ